MIKDRVTRERFSMFSAQVTNLPLEHDPFPAALRIMPAAREINRQILVKMALSAEITDVRLRLASRAFVTGVADFTRIKSLPHSTQHWQPGYWAHLSRSEEHTSVLQSLIRISYAVFFLTPKRARRRPRNSHHTRTTQHNR